MMDFETLYQFRRSCRSFDPSPIPEDRLNAIIKAGIWAPSPLNMQPWEFIVVSDPDIKSQIKKVGEEARQDVIDNGGPGWAEKYGMDFLVEAPVLVIVLVDPTKGGLGNFFDQKFGAIQASSACVQNMMLAAANMDIGSLWFTFFRPQKLKSVLNIPDSLEITAVIPLGKIKDAIKAPLRKDPRIHTEKYPVFG